MLPAVRLPAGVWPVRVINRQLGRTGYQQLPCAIEANVGGWFQAQRMNESDEIEVGDEEEMELDLELDLDPWLHQTLFAEALLPHIPTKVELMGRVAVEHRTGPRKTPRKKPPRTQNHLFGDRDRFGNRAAANFPTLAGGILYEVFESTKLNLEDFAEAIHRSASNLSTIIRGRRDPSLGTLLRMINDAGYKIEVVISEKEGDPFPGYLREIAEIPWHEL